MTHLITDSEVAELLALSPREVARLARHGALPVVHLPGNEIRFDPADIQRFIETRKQPATAGGGK